MGNPLIAGFVEIQHEAKTWAWSGKRLRAKLALPTAVIYISIDPVELQQLREFGSEADFVPPKRGELP
jgi:hypothetical protein